MNKFKVGDRVVIVISDWGVPVGHRTFITEIKNDLYCPYNTPTVFEGDSKNRLHDDVWNERELEHEDVFDSELYKTMKEEE